MFHSKKCFFYFVLDWKKLDLQDVAKSPPAANDENVPEKSGIPLKTNVRSFQMRKVCQKKKHLVGAFIAKNAKDLHLND